MAPGRLWGRGPLIPDQRPVMPAALDALTKSRAQEPVGVLHAVDASGRHRQAALNTSSWSSRNRPASLPHQKACAASPEAELRL